jgi:hypothetical protein
MIVAFVAPDRTGGTEDTIRRAVHAISSARNAAVSIRQMLACIM